MVAIQSCMYLSPFSPHEFVNGNASSLKVCPPPSIESKWKFGKLFCSAKFWIEKPPHISNSVEVRPETTPISWSERNSEKKLPILDQILVELQFGLTISSCDPWTWIYILSESFSEIKVLGSPYIPVPIPIIPFAKCEYP